MNVHGHLHVNNVTMEEDDPIDLCRMIRVLDHRYVNVSCEQINLTPIPFDKILNRWKESS